MAAEIRRFEPVEIPETTESESSFAKAANAAAVEALALGLKALSQRAIAGARALFTLLSTASIFWLWMATLDPKSSQIVSMTIYALVILAANVIVRRV